ncbi:MAG TPA: hypothetical protein VNU44_23370 [Bryobacteraceae bacterium]|jgi:hypothetical protein|nr:hypothetical protein [Bryobacteraceae bacterium]
MDNGEGITKADLRAALKEFKIATKADLIGAGTDFQTEISAVLRQFETNMIAAFRSYDVDPPPPCE